LITIPDLTPDYEPVSNNLFEYNCEFLVITALMLSKTLLKQWSS